MSSVYNIGTCFNCQKCLYCFVDLSKEVCNCDLTKKPSRSDININRSQRGCQIYNRHISSTLLPVQLAFLKEANEKFGYKIDFNSQLDISLCSACNSKYERSKVKGTKKTSQVDTLDNQKLTYINIQIIIKKNNESSPGKWIKLNIENSTTFYNDLLDYVQKTCGNTFNQNNYNITYKVNGRGQLIVLDDDDDFVTFIEKCRDLSGSKHMVIYVNINKSKNNDFDCNHRKKISVSDNSILEYN